MNKRRKYPVRQVVAVDVDGTLIDSEGRTIDEVAQFIRNMNERGWQVWVWSARGERHARMAVKNAGIEDEVTHVLSKPGVIVDDKGWDWVKYTKVITSSDEL